MNALYQAVNSLTDRLDRLDSRLAALESKQTSTPAAPKSSTTPAVAPKAKGSKSTKKTKEPAPTTPSATKAPAPHTIRTISTKPPPEKIVVSLSIPDVQTGHIVGRAGTGLRQIHDLSHAKLSVSPTVVSGSRAVTIRGSDREVGDAISAIGKRLARRKLRTPRSKKPEKSSATAVPIIPTVVEGPSTSPSSSTPTVSKPGSTSRSSARPSPTLQPVASVPGPPTASSSRPLTDREKLTKMMRDLDKLRAHEGRPS